ncbi:alpha-ketoglutarate-dependent dioxygenase alkB homolog 6-like [Hypanus sabinus]|uniref:alpha-ketoglutarate-dependent dioxygenase alkB homolog 6-like n=1 Tax=Hypanus sabinus TaxID=79690 RepID=UPI0028C4EA95|nr:alpha-ketoglutarate-dependent dioxygenase alkB homolog 6-like [Hypanus sabinus]
MAAQNDGPYDLELFRVVQIYDSLKLKWTQLSGRRLQNWDVPNQAYQDYSCEKYIQLQLPTIHVKELELELDKLWIIWQADVVRDKTYREVVISKVQDTEDWPHEDGPLYFPTVTTVSLGSQTLLDFYHPSTTENEKGEIAVPQTEENRYFLSLLVEPRSLLVLKDSMYLKYLHGIRPVSEDVITDKVANLTFCNSKLGAVLTRTTRVSQTIRHVPKVLKTIRLLRKKE